MLPILLKYEHQLPSTTFDFLPERGTLFESSSEALGFNRLRWTVVTLALFSLPLTLVLAGLISFQSHLASVESVEHLIFTIGYFIIFVASGLMFGASLFFPHLFRYHVVFTALLDQRQHRSHYSFMSQRRMKTVFGPLPFTIFIMGAKSGSFRWIAVIILIAARQRNRLKRAVKRVPLLDRSRALSECHQVGPGHKSVGLGESHSHPFRIYSLAAVMNMYVIRQTVVWVKLRCKFARRCFSLRQSAGGNSLANMAPARKLFGEESTRDSDVFGGRCRRSA
ncbi:hypothetical protein B0H19DRAFT_1074342 [Mycena capillaripes]|nr:hypothetical protein B0H19DRAFT_1074342 [Mycena capillaripes]